MKGALALALVLGVWAGRSDGARAFRATMTAEQRDGGAVIAPFDGADPAGNENVEIIPQLGMPSNTPPVKPGCKGVDCASLQSDDGAFAAVLKKAREEVGHMYNHESQSAVVVVTKAYCDKVLAAFKAKAEPYWNTEKRICNAEREHVLAQCEKRVEGFIESLSKYCPNSHFPMNTPSKPGFKKVTYVATIPEQFLKDEFERKKEELEKKIPCPPGMKNCKKLKYTETKNDKTGKLMGDPKFAAPPLPPNAAVDTMAVAAQVQIQKDCAGGAGVNPAQPCGPLPADPVIPFPEGGATGGATPAPSPPPTPPSPTPPVGGR